MDISTKVNTAYLEGVEKIFLCVILVTVKKHTAFSWGKMAV